MNPTTTKSEAKQARVDFDRHFDGNDHVLKFGLRYNQTTLEYQSSEWWLSLAPGTNPASLPHMDAVAKYADFKVRGAGPATSGWTASAPGRRICQVACRLPD